MSVKGYELLVPKLKEIKIISDGYLGDAYCLITIGKNYRKFLIFLVDGDSLEYDCMPIGLTCALLIKPAISFLKKG